MPAPADDIRPLSMHDGVAALLRARIFEGALLPGAWIDEKALAAEWQISRTPLREALKVLSAEGLVELVPHRGCRVVELTDDDAFQLFPVMALLEGECAREAVKNLTAEVMMDLRALHEKLEACAARGDIDAYYRVNHEFHSRVQALAGNRWLDRVTGDLRQFIRLMRGRQLALPGRISQSIQEHRDLMAAFEARSARSAAKQMQAHLEAQLSAFVELRRMESAASASAPEATPRMGTRTSGGATVQPGKRTSRTPSPSRPAVSGRPTPRSRS